MNITELVIPRDKWGTGALQNEDGTMCCLGHASKACGIESLECINQAGDFVSYGMPQSDWDINKELKCPGCVCESSNTCLAHRASVLNDSVKHTNEQKEAGLINIFAEMGIKLSFVDTLG